jgi:hypothetical protein
MPHRLPRSLRALALLPLLAAALAVAPATASASPPLALAQLDVRYWPHGQGHGAPQHWTLTCLPTGGSLKLRTSACHTLISLRAPFAPTPATVACSQIYAGPQVAYVHGTLRARPVSVWLRRRDSCETAAWRRLGALLPQRFASP